MVTRLLELPGEGEAGDAADALAVALCHASLHRRRGVPCVIAHLRGPPPAQGHAGGGRRRRRRRLPGDDPPLDLLPAGRHGDEVSLLDLHPRARGRARPLRLPDRPRAGALRAAHRGLGRRAPSSRSTSSPASRRPSWWTRCGRATWPGSPASPGWARRRRSVSCSSSRTRCRARRPRGRARRPATGSAKDDLLSALVHLGYSRPEAERAVDGRCARTASGRFEDLLRRTLRLLSGR